MDDPSWLPAPLHYSGNWDEWLKAAYEVFSRDFVRSQPRLNGRAVACCKDPIQDGKEAGFWHCTSETTTKGSGGCSRERVPDPRRMERLPWVRAIIENVDDQTVEWWETQRGSDRRKCIWFREEYLIVLAERRSLRNGLYYRLITAYATLEPHRKRNLRHERDAWRGRNG